MVHVTRVELSRDFQRSGDVLYEKKGNFFVTLTQAHTSPHKLAFRGAKRGFDLAGGGGLKRCFQEVSMPD